MNRIAASAGALVGAGAPTVERAGMPAARDMPIARSLPHGLYLALDGTPASGRLGRVLDAPAAG